MRSTSIDYPSIKTSYIIKYSQMPIPVNVEKPRMVRLRFGMSLIASASLPEVYQGMLLSSPSNLFQMKVFCSTGMMDSFSEIVSFGISEKLLNFTLENSMGSSIY